MNVLIFSMGKQGYQEACQLECAKEYFDRGDNVLFVTCGHACGLCNDNRLGNSLRCDICKLRQKQRLAKFVSKSIPCVSIDEYDSFEFCQRAESVPIEFDDIKSLKNLMFNGIEVGYGALSSYITYTRNIDLDCSSELKCYLTYLIRSEIHNIIIGERIFNEFNPDLVVVHNGRFSQYKPFYGLAKRRGVDYLITETITSEEGIVMRDFYSNSIPHDIKVRDKKINEFWNEFETVPEVRENESLKFYNNRKNAKYAGDTIYVKDQVKGKMPEDWDPSKENIVIFNSSEDEYFAIGSEFDGTSFFSSQMEGLKIILEKYKDDNKKHFTLRVHPHLKGLPYAYHQDLYKLKYPNLTVIPASSDISSYSLLDAADKVIVFGSTMGVESTYWGKPTINLAYAIYKYMDVVYYPKDVNELWTLIDNKSLPAKNRENALPYGFYSISGRHPHFKTFDVKMKSFNFMGKALFSSSLYKIFNSSKLYSIIEVLLYKCDIHLHLFCKFKRIPV